MKSGAQLGWLGHPCQLSSYLKRNLLKFEVSNFLFYTRGGWRMCVTEFMTLSRKLANFLLPFVSAAGSSLYAASTLGLQPPLLLKTVFCAREINEKLRQKERKFTHRPRETVRVDAVSCCVGFLSGLSLLSCLSTQHKHSWAWQTVQHLRRLAVLLED